MHSWRQRWSPVVLRVKLRALLLGELVEPFRFQQFIHVLVEGMRWPFRQLVVANPQTLLPSSPPSRTHRHLFFSRMHSHSTRHTGEHKLLQITKQNSRLAPQAARQHFDFKSGHEPTERYTEPASRSL